MIRKSLINHRRWLAMTLRKYSPPIQLRPKRDAFLKMWNRCTAGAMRPSFIITTWGMYVFYRAAHYGVHLNFYEKKNSRGRVIETFGERV